jgi:hypothetical protein
MPQLSKIGACPVLLLCLFATRFLVFRAYLGCSSKVFLLGSSAYFVILGSSCIQQ